MAILAAQSENRQLKDLPQAYFGRVPEGFLLSVRTNSVIENFVYWKLGPLFFFAFFCRFNACFLLECANSRIVDPLIFIH